ncbi:unnamed protein product [Microthlaspi erraticum]|uniref:SKP1-like protein n=1 Tax=Microthlaspi erraticum TaxID=1685480 RepID=A0A6D2I430_9BRAS|nr:unnamed protein product [Microthlaspi erraticum]
MSKKIVLKTSDGESFEIDESIALQSETIAHLIGDDSASTSNGFPLANVTSDVLSTVIEYCKMHASVASEEELKKWDAEFVKVDDSTIFDLILAANYLNISGLLDLTCQTIADKIAACKDADEIRATFDIENDFTPEEEEELRQENQWCFQ